MQVGIDLVQVVYHLTNPFPQHEKYGLASQMQRAAVSVPSNIAEGYARHHRKEYLQHLAMARASLAELDTQMEIAGRLKYISQGDVAPVQEKISQLRMQLYTLRRVLSKEDVTEP
ncbi:MAG: four helix bundle protein [SAR202 cluster bacterium]|nr:four helix bundle protein [SAR202 cluster bacterium]